MDPEISASSFARPVFRPQNLSTGRFFQDAVHAANGPPAAHHSERVLSADKSFSPYNTAFIYLIDKS